MLIRTIRRSDVPEREVTDRALYLGRREFLRTAATATGVLAAAPLLPACGPGEDAQAAPAPQLPPLAAARDTERSTDEPQTDPADATRYNNFYEFGTDKEDPMRNAHTLVTRPWTVRVDGECAKPGTLGIEDLLADDGLVERVYRLRCVEAWSMVIPWIGVPLGSVLARFEPTSKAKYVAFETLHDAEQMPGQRRAVLEWPYREGLRIDEAMHPLALLGLGMYGTVLPNQNGAPVRLVVPWKYGFKSIKSIVRIRFTETQPRTSWNDSAPREYGFYSNVNPDVDHPRWSQKRERRIGDFGKRATLPMNGYAEEVGDLYAGMDLRKLF